MPGILSLTLCEGASGWPQAEEPEVWEGPQELCEESKVSGRKMCHGNGGDGQQQNVEEAKVKLWKSMME